MKRLMFSLLCVIMFCGCLVHGVNHDYSNIKEEVFLDPYYIWSNSPAQEMFKHEGSSLRSITLRVFNRKYCSVKVKVQCSFQPEETIFGENTIIIEPRENKVFTVKGFSRIVPEPEIVGCKILEIK